MSGLLESRRWDVLPSDEAVQKKLVEACSVTPLVARIMAARGIKDVESAREFLSPSLERDWADPLEIPGLEAVANRVERAICQHERIAVFGDFDVDGMTSTAIATLALRELGGQVWPYIPHRFDEGYGLSQSACERVIADCNPDLVLTVDNGISCATEVNWLVAKGVDVAVTDHHEPGDLVPKGVSVADPKLKANCSSRELAGAGVALKLIDILGKRLGKPDLWRSYTDIAALGTISDMMLLVGENRALVADGIKRMRMSERPGLVALAAAANVDLSQITSDELPFSLVPRLNAAGRMGHVEVAFKLLICQDALEATKLAAELESINHVRREIECELADEAQALAEDSYDGGRVIVVAGEGWHEGVKGIVASRLVNRFHVPVLLFTVSDGVAKGSGRSVGNVNLFQAVERCQSLLTRFGGHAGAVGVTLDAANLDAFRERMGEVLGELAPEEFEQKSEVAALVSLDELSMETIDSLEVLQPFGQGNKKPLVASLGVSMRSRSRVGATGDHLRFTATNGVSSLPAIMFRTPHIERAVGYEGAVDLVFDPVVELWQGRAKPKLMVRDIVYRGLSEPESLEQTQTDPTLVDDLFARAPEILARGEYAGIADADTFVTKIVGVSFDGRQDIVSSLVAGEALVVRRDEQNNYDPNAIALLRGTGEQVGFLRRQIAAALAPVMDAGTSYVAHVIEVSGGGEKSYGANIRVERVGAEGKLPQADEEGSLKERARLSALSEAELTDELRQSLIGDNAFLPAQEEALKNLSQGKNTLCVMATGRGKSLIFHVHAAREALLHGKASIFVYPLRALVADQSFHLSEAFASLGMKVRVLTGETSIDERDEIFSSLADSRVDVVLTTPEFLTIHTSRFARTGRVGFVVIDEAHHAGTAKSGNRAAYTHMPEVLEALGNPVALAVTATASKKIAREICRLLSIASEDVIVDEAIRSNLHVEDARELRDRDAALVSIVSSGEKCVVYVNSREQSVMLARTLRKALPDLGQKIAFYNAGLTRSERDLVEDAFRKGELSCIVSTSAFGEGVNLPDIRNVVLYHMPFGQVEFNQMSGRAGRDGNDAHIHMLFGARDARINERILEASAPEREDLVTLYRTLKSYERDVQAQDETSFSAANADIASSAQQLDRSTRLDERSVSCGISVFRELGFLTTSGYGSARRISMVDSPEKMELDRSIRYLEGIRSKDEFLAFREWALGASSDEMLGRINRPITPGLGRSV